MILIKLGGSVITDKTQYRTFEKERVARLCDEIKRSGADTIVVHGAGSFGHVLAKEYELDKGLQDFGQVPAVAKVQYDVRELNSMIINELLLAGIPAFSVPPGSCFVMNKGKLITGESEVLKAAPHIGIMPVMFGDVVFDRATGFGICSGDQIMEVLCEMYNPKKIVFVSDIDGLFDKDPKYNEDAKLIPSVTSEILKGVNSEGRADDVTGGVRAKMEAMLRISTKDRECVLINGTVPGRLYSTLKGEKVISTTAVGGLK